VSDKKIDEKDRLAIYNIPPSFEEEKERERK